MDILKTVSDNLYCRLGFSKTQTIVVAWSGGVDSTALVHALRLLNHPFEAVYFQHGQRATESVEEEKWIKHQAEHWNFPLNVIDLKPKLEVSHGEGFQDTARRLRRRELGALAQGKPIATAHHLDDAWETVVFRLLHGGGSKTFAPMLWKKDGFVKPFLNIEKSQLTTFLLDNNLSHLYDSSNASPKYQRNRLRLEVLPVLENFNPLSSRAKEQALARWRVARERLNGELPLTIEYQESLPFEALSNWEDPEVGVEEWLGDLPCDAWGLWTSRDKVGSCFYNQNGTTIWIERGCFTKAMGGTAEPLEFLINETDQQVECSLGLISFNQLERAELSSLKLAQNQSAFDYSCLQFPLILRKWKPGDHFVPLGLKGKQNISDYLTNHKIPPHKRHNQWVLCSGGEVIWLVGHRSSELHKVVEETQMVYLAQLFKLP